MTQTKLFHIVQKIKRGHKNGISDLMKYTMTDAMTIAKNILLNENEVQDAVQEAYIKVWQNIDSFNQDKGAFLSWFFRIVHNECIDRNRKGRFFQNSEDIDNIRITDKSNEDRLHFKLLKSRALKIATTIPAKQRQVFLLRDIMALSINEVSDLTGMSEGSVKTNLYLARKRIREVLQKEKYTL